VISDLEATTDRSLPGASLRQAYASLSAGRQTDAEVAFRALLRREPQSVGAWNGLGIAAFQARRFKAAEQAFQRALALDPASAEIKMRLAAALRGGGQLDAALLLYEEAAGALNGDASFLNNWGNALADAGQLDKALPVLRQAVAKRPDSESFRVNLARALSKHQDAAEAIQVLEPVLHGSPGPDLMAEYGNALLQCERYQEGILWFRKARAAGHENIGMLHNLATALQFLGDMAGAEEAYRAVLAIDPASAVSRRQLTSIGKFGSTEDDIRQARAQLKASGLSIADRSELYLSLGKAYADIGDHDQAFEHLQAGNQLIRSTLSYSHQRNTELVDAMIDTFSATFMQERIDWGHQSERPIFIVGMPRSGTTLTEQIICSHPRVHGAGELMKIYELFVGLRRKLKPDLGVPRIASLLTPEPTRQAADGYLSYITALDAEASFVTDKLPFNFRYLGFISLLFPRARIIHCQRHPLDIAISCYFARFRDELNFSFNLTEIARYYRDYERLMAHWRNAIPNPLLEISYESLVFQQEVESRRILDFLELEWDDRCRDFHRNERPILTSSNWQVRQPMYDSSVGRWRHYRDHLQPHLGALGIEDPETWHPQGSESSAFSRDASPCCDGKLERPDAG
jgi:tetratricopeptide (TPR) repeat protein